MEFWGFEGRGKLPGDGFGLFVDPVAPTVATAVPTTPVPESPSTPAVGAVVESDASGPTKVITKGPFDEAKEWHKQDMEQLELEIGASTESERKATPEEKYEAEAFKKWANNSLIAARLDTQKMKGYQDRVEVVYARAKELKKVDDGVADVNGKPAVVVKGKPSTAAIASKPDQMQRVKAEVNDFTKKTLASKAASASTVATPSPTGDTNKANTPPPKETPADNKPKATPEEEKKAVEAAKIDIQAREVMKGYGLEYQDGDIGGAILKLEDKRAELKKEIKDPKTAKAVAAAKKEELKKLEGSITRMHTLNGDPTLAQKITATSRSVSGAVGSIGELRTALTYAFGSRDGYGGVGFSYSDPYSSGSGFAGPGGSYANIGFGDLSNTGFSIGLMGGDARSKARALDAMINQLLHAVMQGNSDAIESAITLLSLKSKTTMIGASVHVIRAMQLYDRNMKGISDKMGAVAGQKSDEVSGQLATLNAEMNQTSMARQAIANTLRDIMTMVEEVSNLESSIYSKKDREAQSTRWV